MYYLILLSLYFTITIALHVIDPSPDWIVGVSALELCNENCSWVESKILNLYPWDAGTDSGITYIVSTVHNYVISGIDVRGQTNSEGF